MSLDETVKAFTEILKIVAWPVIVAWLVWYLRDEVKRAAARITELGLAGAKFAPPDQTPSPPPTGGVSEAVSSASLSVAVPSSKDSLALFIANLKAFISEDELEPSAQAIRRDLTNTVGPDPKDQIEALIYFSASRNVALAHERNYNAIFGSQLQLLAQMNVDYGVPQDVARQTYEAAKSTYPEVYRHFPFDHWIGFLQNGGLITVAPSGNYVLTPYGRGFLKYILDRRLSVTKPF